MNGAIAGDIIGSPYRYLDERLPSFTLLETVTGVVSGSVRSFRPHMTDVSLSALATMRWLESPERGDPEALRMEILAMHARYPDVRPSRDMLVWLEAGGVSDPYDPITVDDIRPHLVRAALCGMFAEDSVKASLLAATAVDATSRTSPATQAVAMAAWQLSHGFRDEVPETMMAYGIDLSVDADHESLRNMMVRRDRERISLALLGDWSEISDPETYMAISEADAFSHGRALSTVTIPVYRRRKVDDEDLVKAALAVTLRAGSYTEAVKEAVTLGGDSPLLVSLTGALCHAAGLRPGKDLETIAADYMDPFQRDVMSRYDSSVRTLDRIGLIHVGSAVRYSDAATDEHRDFVRASHPDVEFMPRDEFLRKYEELSANRRSAVKSRINDIFDIVSVGQQVLYSDAVSPEDVRYVLENFGTEVMFLPEEDMQQRYEALLSDSAPHEIAMDRFMGAFDVLSVDGQPRYCDAPEALAPVMRESHPDIVFLSSEELKARKDILEKESAALRVSVRMEDMLYSRPVVSREESREIVQAGTPERKLPDPGRRNESFQVLKVDGRVVMSSALTDAQQEAVRNKFGDQVEFVTQEKLRETYERMDHESRRPEKDAEAHLMGPVVQMRTLFLEKEGIKGISATVLLVTDLRLRESARADLRRLQLAAREIISAQDRYIGNDSGRRLVTATAYRVEVYDDMVVGYRGSSFRDEIGISPDTGLLYRKTSNEFHMGEYSDSDKMLRRMFDGCELYDVSNGRTRVSIERAEESMRHLCLDEGEMYNLETARDEETGYALDSNPYYGEQTRTYMTNMERLDEDVASSRDPELMEALGLGDSMSRYM